jgi:hypothetical protein
MSNSWNSNEPIDAKSDTNSLVRYKAGDESSRRRTKPAYIAFHTAESGPVCTAVSSAEA